jgi:hypothetical protein
VLVRSQQDWNVATWAGKHLVFKVKDDATCGFKLAELVDLTKTKYALREIHEISSQPSIVFSSNCRMKHSSFYKARVAAAIWIVICGPEIGNVCALKAFEFERSIKASDWPDVADGLVEELGVAGNSDRFLRIGGSSWFR